MKRLCLTLLLVFVGAWAQQIIPMTRNPDPEPRYVTYREWREAHPETGTRADGPKIIKTATVSISAADNGLICLVVAENISATLSADLTTYITDLEARGYTVEMSTYSTSGTVEDLKDYLAGKLTEGLVGAILVGELPFAWYQLANDGNANGQFDPGYDFTEEFPCDLYLCDADGVWSDDSTFTNVNSPLSPGSDGTYDSHSGDREPEIWVSRIDASQITVENPVDLYHAYFARVHSYKEAELTFPSKGLFYVDDDWENYFLDPQVEKVCDTVIEERNPVTTDADDYRGRLPQDGLYLTVLVHATPDAHYFDRPDLPTGIYDTLFNHELPDLEPHYGFYNLFACSNCRWIEQDCMGSLYQFCGQGLASIGSAKTGSMLEFDVFNTALGNGASWGEAWITLTEYWMDYYPSFGGGWDQYSRGWYMGMALFGDGTLDLGEQHAIAIAEPETESLPIASLVVTPLTTGDQTQIRFSLPHSQQVTINVFDAAGRLQENLYQGTLSAGEHTLTWDASQASAGVYFVRMVTGYQQVSGRIVLTR
jgi:hypothetical protein